MELNEMEKRMLFRVEGRERYEVMNELLTISRYVHKRDLKETAENIMEKLSPLSDNEFMEVLKDIQTNYRLPRKGRSIGDLSAEARRKSSAEKLKGHDIMALERFDPEVSHMIIFEVLARNSHIGDEGDRMRLFLDNTGYQKILELQREHHVNIENHASVGLGGILHYDCSDCAL